MKFATEWPIYAQPGSGQMKRSHRLANDLRPGQPRDGRSTRLQRDFSPGGPEPTSRNLRSVGLQAAHYRDLDSDEIRIGALSQHLIVLFTKPPAEMTIRCEGVKRDGPSLSSMANRLVSLEECGKRSRSAEPSATLKKQSGINGLLPSLAALGGPLHLFRLLLDLCSRFSNRVAVTFPQEKSLLDFPG